MNKNKITQADRFKPDPSSVSVSNSLSFALDSDITGLDVKLSG